MSRAIPDNISLPELTLRGCLLASMITAFLTAANVYLGLKVGLTFATSIPAAVISMTFLSRFKQSNILENTMVQTFASSAGTLSAVIFVIPGLLMLGVWHEVHYWQVMIMCTVGGILGVLYSVPLRRAMVLQSKLPYPEGVAAAEILLVGSNDDQDPSHPTDEKTIEALGYHALKSGSIIAALYSMLTTGLKVFSSSVTSFLQVGKSVFGLGFSFSPALLGAGFLCGIETAVAMAIGVIISWFILVPLFASQHFPTHINDLAEFATGIWATKVRIIGSGAIAVAAIWALVQLVQPVISGVREAFDAVKVRKENGAGLARTDFDIPMNWVLVSILLAVIPLLIIFSTFIHGIGLTLTEGEVITLAIGCAVFAMVLGVLVAAACGYMAGLVGSSNSPVSGIGVISVIASSLMLIFAVNHVSNHAIAPELAKHTEIALAIYITTIVMAMSAVANDNLQDLKTGQLVGATPWKQQLALIFGVVVGSFIVPAVISSLYHSYGFVGAMPRPDMNLKEALFAPQANLMSDLAKGIITHELDWSLFFTGAGIAVSVILLDEFILGRLLSFRISSIAVAMGIYLPFEVNTTIIAGGFLSYFVYKYISSANLDEQNCEQMVRKGILLSSGLIVGESLMGVVLSMMVGFTGNENFMAVNLPWLAPLHDAFGFFTFLMLILGCYYYLVTNKSK